jgi:RimJ/RimL family protein N-acetyltransferase
MKPYVRGKSIYLREVVVNDAEFIVGLRTDIEKSKYLSKTANDIEQQKRFILNYQESITDYYFLICNWSHQPLGTIRIYDIRDDSFCWGSWIIVKNAPAQAAIESALLIYDFSFFSLHYKKSHFDVRKENKKVIDFHMRFGATIDSEDIDNYYFKYDLNIYLKMREKYRRYIP